MIEIGAGNENAVVRQIGGNSSINIDGFPGSKPSERTFSPPPSLETLSISTTSSVLNNHLKYSEVGDNGNGNGNGIDNDNDNDNDCSSSVSSQYSDSATARNPPKRSVFSQYWKKTGQKPVPLRPARSLSTPNLLQRIPPSLTPEISPLRTEEFPGSSSADPDIECRAIRSMSNADFLEDDGDSSYQHEPASPQVALKFPGPQPPSPSLSLQRRRSILPPAPRSHPALKSTLTHGSKSWRKSLSLSSVEGYSRTTNPLAPKHKTQSLPRLRSTSSQLRPGPSCLRPYQKYSPSKTDAASRKKSDPLSPPSSHTIQSLSESVSCSFSRSGMLSRTESCSSTGSSVSFLEVVDVRHFEKPRETYAGQGWSDYFK